MIAIVDYGLGNVSAFANVYKRSNIPHVVAEEPDDLSAAKGIILPGVGAFDHAMQQLEASPLYNALVEKVSGGSVWVLGICVGMQMLASASDEGIRPGLGWIDGVVRRLDISRLQGRTLLPHMGWNKVDPVLDQNLFDGLNSNSRFYFLHSYVFECDSKDNILSTTEYGDKFTSAVGRDRILGVQFHPEKSHQSGIRLLKNFACLAMAS